MGALLGGCLEEGKVSLALQDLGILVLWDSQVFWRSDEGLPTSCSPSLCFSPVTGTTFSMTRKLTGGHVSP